MNDKDINENIIEPKLGDWKWYGKVRRKILNNARINL
jgi:hypothetical protein